MLVGETIGLSHFNVRTCFVYIVFGGRALRISNEVQLFLQRRGNLLTYITEG
jgi:hypothetical protein